MIDALKYVPSYGGHNKVPSDTESIKAATFCSASGGILLVSIIEVATLCSSCGGALLVSITAITATALFIITCLGSAGVMSGPSLYWSLIGLGAHTSLCTALKYLLSDRYISMLIPNNMPQNSEGLKRNTRVVMAIVTICFALHVVGGILGLNGLVTSTQASWIGLGSSLASSGVLSALTCYGCCVAVKNLELNEAYHIEGN